MAYTPASPSSHTVRILCVEDNPDDVELLALALERAAPARGYEIERVEEALAMRQALQREVDIVLCDYHLPRFSPQAALALLREVPDAPPLVVVTRAIGEQAAVEVLRAGARDYVTKDRLGTLPQVIDRVLAERAREAEAQTLTRELAHANQRLRAMSARLVAAQERERSLISHELHDQLAQTLAAMLFHLHAARATQDPQQARQFADSAQQMAQAAIDQLKSLSFDLRPAQLDTLGLAGAIEAVVQPQAEAAGMRWSLSCRGQAPQDASDNQALALRLVQEAMDNIVRHAQATRVQARLRFLPGGRLSVLVADDGRGFDTARPALPHQGGLQALVERAELAGGEIRIRSRPGRGAILRAML